MVEAAATNGHDSSPLHNALGRLAEGLLHNQLLSRREYARRADARRDVRRECGHPDPGSWTSEDYDRLCGHDAIAHRAARVMASECWQVSPRIYDSEDPEVVTPWEEEARGLAAQLRGPGGVPSRYRGQEGSPVNAALAEADALSNYGRYAVVLCGLDDRKELSEPAARREGQKLLYLRPLAECRAAPGDLDADRGSPRFGLPLYYNVPDASGEGTQKAHWTRCVHVARGGAYHDYPLAPVLDRLLDLQKLYGASAEMYWLGAFLGLVVTTNPAFPDLQFDASAAKDEVEKFMNGLQRFLRLQNMDAKGLAPQVVDPTPQVMAQIKAICVQKAIPERVFTGSERGELASSQDADSWDGRVRGEQSGHCTPDVVVPFYDRMIWLGVLSDPPAGYEVWWPDRRAQSEESKAAVALSLSRALAAYASGGCDARMALADYLTLVFGLSDEEAKQVVESEERLANVAKAEADKAAEREAKAKRPAAPGFGRGA